jgi:hypothetical protein
MAHNQEQKKHHLTFYLMKMNTALKALVAQYAHIHLKINNSNTHRIPAVIMTHIHLFHHHHILLIHHHTTHSKENVIQKQQQH